MFLRCSAHGAAPAAAPVPARAGIGLRFPHHRPVLDERPLAAWFEVHPENYLGAGVAVEMLERIRADYPLSLHATGLSLGSDGGLDLRHVERLRALEERLEPGLVSDHLSWSSAGGAWLPDLLPLPYSEEALAVVARNVNEAQSLLRRPILVENPSAYLAMADSAMTEAEFLAALVASSGCGVLLDVNNVFVSARNLGEDPALRLGAMLDAIPHDAIGEIHLAGHAERPLPDGGVLLVDDHGSAVRDEVWRLYETVIARLGPRPTLIEWDTDVPPFAVLQAEAARAQPVLDWCEETRLARAG